VSRFSELIRRALAGLARPADSPGQPHLRWWRLPPEQLLAVLPAFKQELPRLRSRSETSAMKLDPSTGAYEWTLPAELTRTPGVYNFTVTATATDARGHVLERTEYRQVQVIARPEPRRSAIDVQLLRKADSVRYRIDCVVCDAHGNICFPDDDRAIAVDLPDIHHTRELRDDGTVRVTFSLPAGRRHDDPANLALTFAGAPAIAHRAIPGAHGRLLPPSDVDTEDPSVSPERRNAAVDPLDADADVSIVPDRPLRVRAPARRFSAVTIFTKNAQRSPEYRVDLIREHSVVEIGEGWGTRTFDLAGSDVQPGDWLQISVAREPALRTRAPRLLVVHGVAFE